MIGHFTTTGDCNSHYNVATVTSPMGTVWRDSVCVVVVEDTCRANLTIANNTYSQSLGTGYTGQSIFIAGIFYVNNTFTFNNCSVYTAPTAQIIIQAGGILVLNGTTIEGCRYMWAGIEVLNGGKINVNSSYIKDAAAGITLRNGGIAKSVNSNFYDCIVGIDAQPEISQSDVYGNASLTVTGSTFRALNGYKPVLGGGAIGTNMYIGIRLNRMACGIGDKLQNSNTFSYTIHGIYANLSYVRVENSYFYSIYNNNTWSGSYRGTAVVSLGSMNNLLSRLKYEPMTNGTNTVFSSDRGVYANYSNVEIKNLKMTTVGTGIYAAHCNPRQAIIFKNTITASKYGISLSVNAGAALMQVDSNTVTMQGSTQGVGISISESTSGDAHYTVTGNSITLNNAATGIYVNATYNAKLRGNNIVQNSPNYTYPNTTGIFVNGCDKAQLTCNNVFANYPNTVASKGYHLNVSRNNTMSCNSSTNHNIGVFFGGSCGGTDFNTQIMSYHAEGLHLNTQATIGTQTQSGNKWIYYTSNFGAVNDNFGGELLSQFRVNQGMGIPMQTTPQYYPAIPFINQQNAWFVPQAGAPRLCQPNIDCRNPIPPGDDHDLERAIAQETMQTTTFEAETKAMNEEYLFETLAEDTVLISTDTVFANFYNEKINAATGKLYDVKTDLEDAARFTLTEQQTLANAQLLIKQKTDSLYLLEQQNNITPLVNFESLMLNLKNTLNTINVTVKNILLQHDINADGVRANAGTKNAAIIPLELPETTSKYLNEMNLIYEEQGLDGIPPFYADILAIANLCPFEGGVAVYQARTLVALFNDSIVYNDDMVCLQSGIYRMGSTKNEIKSEELKIIPNPASDEVTILTGSKNGICLIELFNVMGEKLLTEKLDCKVNEHKISVKNFANGIYSMKLKTETSTLNQKIIVVH